MLLCFMSIASNPANALESHPCIFSANNSPGITSLRKTRGGRVVANQSDTPPNARARFKIENYPRFAKIFFWFATIVFSVA